MNDLGAGVIEQYDISVIKTLRGRGATILETTQGYKRLMEYNGTFGRLEYMSNLLEYIYSNGFKYVDLIIKNNEGSLISCDNGGNKFIITDWFMGNECDVKSQNNIYESATTLAKLHNITAHVSFNNVTVSDSLENDADTANKTEPICIPATDNLLNEYNKHNSELRRAATYIRKRKHKSQFEYDILKHMDEFLNYGISATEDMKNSSYEALENIAHENGSICHGSYNYHNIIFTKNKIAVVNFDKSGCGTLIKDLYLFFRKVMEKHDWDKNIGHKILENYDNIRPIPSDEYKLLKIMLMYPEKFWKVVNHYYNSNKSWLPDKDLEKLKLVYYQQKKKEDFVESM